MQCVAYFCVFLSDKGNVFNYLRFDSICFHENTHQLNRAIHFMLISNHNFSQFFSVRKEGEYVLFAFPVTMAMVLRVMAKWLLPVFYCCKATGCPPCD